MLSQDEAVGAIMTGRMEFYVETGGQRQRVIVALNESGRPYLKVETDGVEPNQLLDLPEYRWGAGPARNAGRA